MEIASIKTLKDLESEIGKETLKNTPPYCFHPHIQQYLLDREDWKCTFFFGEPVNSFVLKDPLRLDRPLIKEMWENFPSEKYGRSKSFNWYYNAPNFIEQFWVRRKETLENTPFSDAELIGSKFRNPPLMPLEITDWLLKLIYSREKLPPEQFPAYGIMHGPKLNI